MKKVIGDLNLVHIDKIELFDYIGVLLNGDKYFVQELKNEIILNTVNIPSIEQLYRYPDLRILYKNCGEMYVFENASELYTWLAN